MFTGIVQGVSTITSIKDAEGLRTLTLEFPSGFSEALCVGASVAVDGVCLTVTSLLSPTLAEFEVVLQSLSVTTLGCYCVGAKVNTERAAKDGAEIGGHPLSGHIDFAAQIASIRTSRNNHVLRVQVPPDFRKYIFQKGYIAINGASLTVSEVDRSAGWFEVWLIPETRRMTVFEQKQVGDWFFYLSHSLGFRYPVPMQSADALWELVQHREVLQFSGLLSGRLSRHGL